MLSHRDPELAGHVAPPPDASRAIERHLAQVLEAFSPASGPAAHRNGTSVPSAIFQRLTAREFCYLGRARVEHYRPSILGLLEHAVEGGQPIDFSYDLGGGYHASLDPSASEPSFDVGLGELYVLHQIARFGREIESVHPPGVRFHVVIDNLCALLVNDIPLAKTEGYCARFRELIRATGMDRLVRLIVESEHFEVGDFLDLPATAAGAAAVSLRERENVARFLGRPCTEDEASVRVQRYRDVIPESERLLNAVIRGVHMTQRATPETISFRPFPGADSRIQCGQVALRPHDRGRLCPFLLTSQNRGAYRVAEARVPGLPAPLGALLYAEPLETAEDS